MVIQRSNFHLNGEFHRLCDSDVLYGIAAVPNNFNGRITTLNLNAFSNLQPEVTSCESVVVTVHVHPSYCSLRTQGLHKRS